MNLYGIFWTDPTDGRRKWNMVWNKREAIRQAKLHNGQVRVMRDDPSCPSWDAPTFRVLSDPVVDYRIGQPAE